MWGYTVQAVAERGLFDAGVVELKGGRWSLRVEEGAKLLATCYLMLHHKLFKDSYDGPAKLLNSEEVAGDVEKYVHVVRTTIWKVHGFNGKKNCPSYDAVLYQAKRADAVLEYWGTAYDPIAKPVRYAGRGWIADTGDTTDDITSANVVLQLSDYALLQHGGKVKLLTCACRPVPGPNKCTTCKCAKRGVRCVFGYCKCKLACVEGFQMPGVDRGGESPVVASASGEEGEKLHFRVDISCTCKQVS